MDNKLGMALAFVAGTVGGAAGGAVGAKVQAPTCPEVTAAQVAPFQRAETDSTATLRELAAPGGTTAAVLRELAAPGSVTAEVRAAIAPSFTTAAGEARRVLEAEPPGTSARVPEVQQ